jgi:type VI secretion system protein ImpF
MSRPLEDEPLLASIRDRLTGLEGVGRFAGRQNLEEFLASVHRDLQELLNTRWKVEQWPPSLDELDASLVNFGIPDFTGANMSSPQERMLFCELVEKSIKLHDPRFIHVRIRLSEDGDSLDRTFHFRIEAEIRATPEPAEVVFDSEVDPTSHRIKVKISQ